MSWASTGKAVTDGKKVKIETTDISQIGYGESESTTAIKQGLLLVDKVISSGVLGSGEFMIHLQGHSNPGGEPAKDSNWARDYMVVRIENAIITPVTVEGEAS